MKKIYTVVAVLALALAANAQSNNRPAVSEPVKGQIMTNQTPQVIHMDPSSTAAVGDTVFVFDGYYVYDWNGTLPATFGIQEEDIDGLTPDPNIQGAFGTASGFNFFYDIDPTSSLHYIHADSVFFAGACSWFSPLAQADNWLEMGPITVPATGGTLKWRHNMPDGSYRDGYEVLISTTGMSNYNDFTNPAAFSVADMANSTAGDTVNFPYNVYAQRSADISSYAGQDVYIAFHHNANDMFILYLTDIMLLEGPASVNNIEAAGFTVGSNYPNPANGSTTILYSLDNNNDVLFNVYDMSGKVVYTESVNGQSAGAHRFDLNTTNMSNGLYYYTITVNGQQVSRKFAVANN